MHFHFDRPLNLERLAEMRLHHHHHGGRSIVYLSCTSVILVCHTTPRLVWIPREKNPHLVGLKHSISSLLLGWWSISGLFYTPLAITHNLLGGFNLTPLILNLATDEGEIKWEGADHGREFQNRRLAAYIAFMTFLLLFGLPALLYFLAVVLPGWVQ